MLHTTRTTTRGEQIYSSVAAKALSYISSSQRPSLPIYEPYYLTPTGTLRYPPPEKADSHMLLDFQTFLPEDITVIEKGAPKKKTMFFFRNYRGINPLFDTMQNTGEWAEWNPDWDKNPSLPEILWSVTLNVFSELPKFNEMLNAASKVPRREDRPIIMLITSKVHAIIYILHEGQLYTCGYGYGGNSEKWRNPVVQQKMDEKTRDSSSLLYKLTHPVDILPGALYTADYLEPADTQTANIAWIDFLNEEHVARMQDFLNRTTSIVFNGDIVRTRNSKRYSLTPHTMLVLDRKYIETAGFIPVLNESDQAYNCLLWAQNILNVNIDCGPLGDPKDCRGLTEEQWQLFYKNLNNPSQLGAIVDDIQRSLMPNVCSRIARALRICGGGRRNRRGRGTRRRRPSHVLKRKPRHSRIRRSKKRSSANRSRRH